MTSRNEGRSIQTTGKQITTPSIKGSITPEPSARMRKAKEAQRLTNLYGTNIQCVALTNTRLKSKRRSNHSRSSRVDIDCHGSSSFHSNNLSDHSSSCLHQDANPKQLRPSSSNYIPVNEKSPTQFGVLTPLERLAHPKTTVSKFKDRQMQLKDGGKGSFLFENNHHSLTLEMHADNHPNIFGQPWFLGYSNSTALPTGSPLCLASRYVMNMVDVLRHGL